MSGTRESNHPPPTVSVVVTTYNRAWLLPRALESVWAQEFTDFELIVVDDGSTDETAQLMTAYADSTVTYCRLPHNSGLSVARNQGIRLAHGDYVAFLDDDDWYPPDFLAVVVATLESAPPSVGFLLPALQMMQAVQDGHILQQRLTYGRRVAQVEPGAAYRQLPIGAGSGLVLTRACVEQVGEFDPEFYFAGDLDYLIRASLQFDFIVMPDVALMMSNHAAPQNTTPSVRFAQMTERLVDKHRNLLPKIVVKRRYRNAARLFYRLGDRANGRRVMGKLLRGSPISPKMWGWWVAFEMADYLPIRLQQRIFQTSRHG
jgi:glycosyltransferase involved in cell wall biosynthesis